MKKWSLYFIGALVFLFPFNDKANAKNLYPVWIIVHEQPLSFSNNTFNETYLGTRDYELYGSIEQREKIILEEEVFNILKEQLEKDPSIQIHRIQADSFSDILANPEPIWTKLKNNFGNEGAVLEVKISKRIYTSYENNTKSSIALVIGRAFFFLEKEKMEGEKETVLVSPKKHLKDFLMNNGELLNSSLEKIKKVHLKWLAKSDISKRISIRKADELNGKKE